MRRIILYILLVLFLLPVDGYARKANAKVKSQTTTVARKGKRKTSGKTVTTRKSVKKAPARMETAAEAQRRERETQQEIARTKKQIQENESKVKKSLNELGRIQSDIVAGEKIVNRTAAEVSSLDDKIAGLEKEITASEAELSKMRSEYLKSLKKVRARKNSTSDLAFIFGADSFRQALQRMRYLRQISAWRKKRSAEISDKVEILSRDKDELARSREVKDRTLQTQLTAQQTLQVKYARQDAVVANLKQNGKALKSHLSKKQAEANALKSRIATLIAEENRKAEEARKREEARRAAELKAKKNLAQTSAQEDRKETDKADKKDKKDFADARNKKPRSSDKKSKDQTNKNSTAGNNRQPANAGENNKESGKRSGSGFAGMRGALPRPVNGAFRITSKFGRHALPELPDVVYDNPGIDAETASGASAVAVYGGKVSGVYMIPGFSTVIIVNHGSYYTVYGNIASAKVRVGDQVKQGSVLGSLAPDEDNPGHSSIHFEVWHNRDKLNPEAWIR